MNATLFGNRVFEGVIKDLEMRSFWMDGPYIQAICKGGPYQCLERNLDTHRDTGGEAM